MSNKMQRIGWGLIFGLCALLVVPASSNAQVLKGLKNTKSKGLQPLKDTQGAIKNATQPVRDTRQGVQEITNTPREVTQEVKRTTDEVTRAKNDVRSVKTDAQKAKNDLGMGNKNNSNNKKNNNSSTSGSGTFTPAGSNAGAADAAKTDSAATGTVLDDGRTHTATVKLSGDRSETKSTNSGGAFIDGDGSGAETASEPADMSYRTVELPPDGGTPRQGTATSAAASSSRSSYDGPAKVAVESAEFDMETLEELFEDAVWEGPERDHTLRSINYTLGELRNSIDKIKRMDPMAETRSYETQYRQWMAKYNEMKDAG